jgi:hypothetical protein
MCDRDEARELLEQEEILCLEIVAHIRHLTIVSPTHLVIRRPRGEPLALQQVQHVRIRRTSLLLVSLHYKINQHLRGNFGQQDGNKLPEMHGSATTPQRAA